MVLVKKKFKEAYNKDNDNKLKLTANYCQSNK